jgi:phage baseplate assembly protein W
MTNPDNISLQNFSPIETGTGNRLVEENLGVIFRNVYNILITPKRSVPFQPEFGSSLYEYLYEPLDDTLVEVVQNELYRDIVRWEDRFDNIAIKVFKDTKQHLLAIEIQIAAYGKVEEIHLSNEELSR